MTGNWVGLKGKSENETIMLVQRTEEWAASSKDEFVDLKYCQHSIIIPHSNDTVSRTGEDGGRWIPLVVLREADAEDVLRPTHLLTHKSVDTGQRVAVDRPQVKPSTRAGGNVTRQFVDGNGSKRRTVSAQLADERQSTQVPDDGRTIARARHEQLEAGRSCQTGDRLCVTVEVLIISVNIDIAKWHFF